MNVNRTVCDVKDCKNENARNLSKCIGTCMDGAGSMEKVYLDFDLCVSHATMLLNKLLDTCGEDELRTWLNNMGVNFR